MLLRNSDNGGLEVYDIANNQITGSFFLGNVGLDWQFAGVASISAAGASDLVLRNNLGAFQAYTIAGNNLVGSASLGAPGPDWQLGDFAASTPTGSMAQMLSSSSRPVAVPLTIASMVLDATFASSNVSPPVCCALVSGTMR